MRARSASGKSCSTAWPPWCETVAELERQSVPSAGRDCSAPPPRTSLGSSHSSGRPLPDEVARIKKLGGVGICRERLPLTEEPARRQSRRQPLEAGITSPEQRAQQQFSSIADSFGHSSLQRSQAESHHVRRQASQGKGGAHRDGRTWRPPPLACAKWSAKRGTRGRVARVRRG